MSNTVVFRNVVCSLDMSQMYGNGRQAIRLITPSGELMAVATVNIPDAILAQDEVLIKDWSENEGIYKALNDAGLISSTLFKVESGHVAAHVCKLLIKGNENVH